MHIESDVSRCAESPFVAGATVVVWLSSPREKFWGMLLDLSPAGLSICGIDLNSFDDFVSLLRAGEPVKPGQVFFPMQRIERIEMDLRSGDVPSLGERLESAIGQPVTSIFGQHQVRSVHNR